MEYPSIERAKKSWCIFSLWTISLSLNYPSLD